MYDLDVRAFDITYNSFAADGQLTEDGRDYERVKKALLDMFVTMFYWEWKVRRALEALLDLTNIMHSMERLLRDHERAKRDEVTMFSLLKHQSWRHTKLA